MKNRLLKTYFIISTFVLILIMLISAIFLLTVYKNNSDNAVSLLDNMKSNLTTVYLADDNFNSELFKNRIKKIISDNKRIQAIVLSDSSNKVSYLYIKNRKILKDIPSETGSAISYPQYRNIGLFYSVFNSTVIIPGNNSYNLEIVYQVISNNDIAGIMKISIIILLIFIILSIVFILYLPEKNKPVITVNVKDDKKEISSQESSKLQEPNNLVWEEYLEKKLDYELEKAASFDQDVTFAVISFEKSSNDIKGIKKNLIETVSSYFSHDLSFEFGKKGFAVIIPDTDLETGISRIKALIIRFEQLFNIEEIFSGLSSRNGRLISSGRLIKEATGALNKAFSEPDRKIIAFRSDPEKYREYISSRNFDV